VIGSSRLQLEFDADLVDPQGHPGALVHHVQHVRAGIGQVAQQGGECTGTVGDGDRERELAAGRREPVPKHPHQQHRVDVAA
jgi:hypothetical protein